MADLDRVFSWSDPENNPLSLELRVSFPKFGGEGMKGAGRSRFSRFLKDRGKWVGLDKLFLYKEEKHA